jgi:hypothetical protein
MLHVPLWLIYGPNSVTVSIVCGTISNREMWLAKLAVRHVEIDRMLSQSLWKFWIFQGARLKLARCFFADGCSVTTTNFIFVSFSVSLSMLFSTSQSDDILQELFQLNRDSNWNCWFARF